MSGTRVVRQRQRSPPACRHQGGGTHISNVGLKRSQRASWSSASTAAAVAARKRATRSVRGKSDGMRSAWPPRRAALASCTSFHRSDICRSQGVLQHWSAQTLKGTVTVPNVHSCESQRWRCLSRNALLDSLAENLLAETTRCLSKTLEASTAQDCCTATSQHTSDISAVNVCRELSRIPFRLYKHKQVRLAPSDHGR